MEKENLMQQKILKGCGKSRQHYFLYYAGSRRLRKEKSLYYEGEIILKYEGFL